MKTGKPEEKFGRGEIQSYFAVMERLDASRGRGQTQNSLFCGLKDIYLFWPRKTKSISEFRISIGTAMGVYEEEVGTVFLVANLLVQNFSPLCTGPLVFLIIWSATC